MTHDQPIHPAALLSQLCADDAHAAEACEEWMRELDALPAPSLELLAQLLCEVRQRAEPVAASAAPVAPWWRRLLAA